MHPIRNRKREKEIRKKEEEDWGKKNSQKTKRKRDQGY